MKIILLLFVTVEFIMAEIQPKPRSNPVVIETDRSRGVQVPTAYGTVEGFIYDAPNGTVGNIFLGVPFAAPPIGELRLERPVPPNPWKDVLQTKEFRASCIPYLKMWIQNPNFSEDCLYLNIMAPHSPSTDPAGYPVLVYIHGGGYCFGDVIKAGFGKITTNFVSRGVIVVTVPYRVGFYGFFSTGTKDAEGNNGLWDQLMALKFIKENIRNFGGNPENITLWGQSAGAGSVDALALSPHSRDLFQKVYQASGCIFNFWGTATPVVRTSLNLAKKLGCSSDDPAQIKAFMKKVPWEHVMEVSSNEFTSDFVTDSGRDDYIIFGPRLDDSFFGGKTLEDLLDEAPPKPTLMGLMSQESGPFLFFSFTPEQLEQYSLQHLEKNIEETIATKNLAESEAEHIKKDLLDFYGEGHQKATAMDHFNRHADLISDVMFVQQVLNETDLKTERNWPVYLYVWDYVNEDFAESIKWVKGAFHSYDLPFFFDQKVFMPTAERKEDKQIEQNIAEIICNFAKTGNPSTNFAEFPKFDLKDRKTLWFDLKSAIKADPFKERRLFWKDHVTKFDFNALRSRTQKQIQERLTF